MDAVIMLWLRSWQKCDKESVGQTGWQTIFYVWLKYFLIWIAKDITSYITVALCGISPLFDEWRIRLAVRLWTPSDQHPPNPCLWQGSVNGDYVAIIEHLAEGLSITSCHLVVCHLQMLQCHVFWGRWLSRMTNIFKLHYDRVPLCFNFRDAPIHQLGTGINQFSAWLAMTGDQLIIVWYIEFCVSQIYTHAACPKAGPPAHMERKTQKYFMLFTQF